MKTTARLSRSYPRLGIGAIVAIMIGAAIAPKAFGQVRAGVAYLKLMPGTRELGVAGTLTGGLDYGYAFHANPGATGFLREWLWSASYTKWIADSYNASFLHGRRIKTRWSQQTRLAVGVNYLGIPEFDSSNETAAPVSGNHLLITTSLGQPLSFLSPNISIGANVKYFNSRLAQFETNSLIFDYGMLIRTEQLRWINPNNRLFSKAILSAGIAVTNLGSGVKYSAEATPLPTTFRAGVALNLGSHDGLQFNLGTDYRKVRDEKGFFSFGSEINWSQFISMRMGYSLEPNILGHFTFGASLQLDDALMKNVMIGRNNGMRLDFASNQNNDLMAAPYHGSISHFPVGPEQFNLTGPGPDARLDQRSVTLAWQNSRDPDLFDEIDYWLLVDTDSTKIAKTIDLAKKDKDELFAYLNDRDDFKVNRSLQQTYFELTNLKPGDYYWAVFSFDQDRHLRFAEMKNKPIARFQIAAPAPRVIALNFEYHPWITEDDYQGKILVVVGNFGTGTAQNLMLSLSDSTAALWADSRNSLGTPDDGHSLLAQLRIPELKPGAIDTVLLDWRTSEPGLHRIIARIADGDSDAGDPAIIHRAAADFYTIPKGRLDSQDTVVVQTVHRIVYELPYVGKVFFTHQSAEVERKFIREWIMSPPLTTFAERAKRDPNLMIYLKGSADVRAGEPTEIAKQRATAVRDTLCALGVKPEQITILSDTIVTDYHLPPRPDDAEWIQQDKKFVELMVDADTEEELFGPLQNLFDEAVNHPVRFEAQISGVVPLSQAALNIANNEASDRIAIRFNQQAAGILQPIDWSLPAAAPSGANNWIGKPADYSIAIVDSLGRSFRTLPKTIFLKEQILGREKMYYVIAKFAKAKELYHFYWSNLLDRIPFLLKDNHTRMRFVGHGCAIGPDEVNQRLSEQRARAFHEKFLSDVKRKYPELYDDIKSRIDPPIGLGETEPLTFKTHDGKTVVLGDNETPIGRQLNRRVMVHFYSQP